VSTMTIRRGGVVLTDLRRATAAVHASIDQMVDLDGLVGIRYYAAVAGGLIEAAEVIEAALLTPDVPPSGGLSIPAFSKRMAIDSESAFLDDLLGPDPRRWLRGSDGQPFVAGASMNAQVLGLLYVYVGSALGGLHLLRVARTAPWWRRERQHLLLRPYGEHLNDRWRTMLSALERLDGEETEATVMAAQAGFALHQRCLTDHLAAGGYR
jgi:heme oxygenase